MAINCAPVLERDRAVILRNVCGSIILVDEDALGNCRQHTLLRGGSHHCGDCALHMFTS